MSGIRRPLLVRRRLAVVPPRHDRALKTLHEHWTLRCLLFVRVLVARSRKLRRASPAPRVFASSVMFQVALAWRTKNVDETFDAPVSRVTTAFRGRRRKFCRASAGTQSIALWSFVPGSVSVEVSVPFWYRSLFSSLEMIHHRRLRGPALTRPRAPRLAEQRPSRSGKLYRSWAGTQSFGLLSSTSSKYRSRWKPSLRCRLRVS